MVIEASPTLDIISESTNLLHAIVSWHALWIEHAIWQSYNFPGTTPRAVYSSRYSTFITVDVPGCDVISYARCIQY
jgi:hypothetical protein